MTEKDIRETIAGVCGKLDQIVSDAGKRVSPVAAVPLVLAAGLVGAACDGGATPEYMAPCHENCGPYGGTGGTGGLGAAGGTGGQGGVVGGGGAGGQGGAQPGGSGGGGGT